MQVGDLDNAESDQPFRQVREARLERLDAQNSRPDVAGDRADDEEGADGNDGPARGGEADPERQSDEKAKRGHRSRPAVQPVGRHQNGRKTNSRVSADG